MKGTPSMGKKNRITHVRCRRCGRVAYKKNNRECAACGYGKSAKLRSYSWQTHNLTRGKRKLAKSQIRKGKR
jgi:large subunit ribosomal protein L37e